MDKSGESSIQQPYDYISLRSRCRWLPMVVDAMAVPHTLNLRSTSSPLRPPEATARRPMVRISLVRAASFLGVLGSMTPAQRVALIPHDVFRYSGLRPP